jgi:DNA polymerase I
LQIVLDIETNSLINPSKIWCIVARDIDTGELHVFREPIDQKKFLAFAEEINLWVGHNILGYDLPVLYRLLGLPVVPIDQVVDTLIVSKLIDYSRPNGHSIEAYGEQFDVPKIKHSDYTQYSSELERRCIVDVDISLRIYRLYGLVINSVQWLPSLRLEHEFQLVVNDLHSNGFHFNSTKATKLLEKVTTELGELDGQISQTFKPKPRPLREVNPRLTQHGTLHKGDFRFVVGGDLSEYNGGPFCRFTWEAFNPHKQVINVLNQAGWSPVDKTQAHIDTEREINRARYLAKDKRLVDIDELSVRLEGLKNTGWKINENNLSTLPLRAPPEARLLTRRILLESRRRTLTEWLSLVGEDNRIHGNFQGIGAWTHRMSHQRPNTANIPNEFDTQGKKKLLGKEMRSLWSAPRHRLLVGVDAEGIQLRIFAHYIDDPEFTEALVKGKKDDKTDPHSLNQRVLGSICKNRQAAKRFVYALLLGAGLWKLSQILECSEAEAREALSNLLRRYTGFQEIKENVIPKDAGRGWFLGLDGRKVKIPGETLSERKHLTMSGYLQNGEAIVMKKATLKWKDWLKDEEAQLVNFVHDEWQTECPNNVDTAIRIATRQSESLRLVGEELGLKCPLAGSYWSDENKDYTIGSNWSATH